MASTNLPKYGIDVRDKRAVFKIWESVSVKDVVQMAPSYRLDLWVGRHHVDEAIDDGHDLNRSVFIMIYYVLRTVSEAARYQWAIVS